MEGSVKASGVDDGGGKGGEVGVGVLNGIVGNKNVGRGMGVVLKDIVGTGVAVEIALWVSPSPVLTVDMWVSTISSSLTIGIDLKLLQDASSAARHKRINVLPKMFILHFPLMICKETLNPFSWASG